MVVQRRHIYSVLSFCAVTLLLFGIFAGVIYRRGNFTVYDIPLEIQNSPQASALLIENVRERLERKLESYEKRRIWNMNLSALQASLIAEDWVKAVRIQRSFPNEVRVQVELRRPVLLFADSRTGLVPVAEDGRFLRRTPRNLIPDLPILRGALFENDESLRRTAIDLLKALPEKGLLSEKNIADISYDRETGYEVYLMNSRTTVKLGHDALSSKLARVNRVLDYLQSQQLRGRVIDASFSKKVLVRLRKDQ